MSKTTTVPVCEGCQERDRVILSLRKILSKMRPGVRTKSPTARRLHALRVQAGLSQRALGDMIGLSQAVISKVETGVFLPNAAREARWVQACRREGA